MKINNAFHEEELKNMTDQQLDALLQEELRKEPFNEEVVKQLLDILEEREANMPTDDVDVEAAWQAFHDQYSKPVKEIKVRSSKAPSRWLVRVAAAAAVICLIVFAAPAAMGAENIFTIIGRWTADIFAFFTPGGANAQQEYEFKTDHPGLQQVYDAVAELGLTEPIVPMWLPEELELTELKVKELPNKSYVFAEFVREDSSVTIQVELREKIEPVQYLKDDKEVEIYESFGTKHYIYPNEDKWNAVWVNGNVEQLVFTDYSKEVLLQIIDSIYSEG